VTAADALFTFGAATTVITAAVGLAVLGTWARFAAADFHRAATARVASYTGGPVRPTHRHTRSK